MLLRSLAVVLAAGFIVCVLGGGKSHVDEIRARCREEHHLELDKVPDFNKTKHLETTDDRVKCFIKCVMVGLKLMNEDGDLTLENDPDRMMIHKKHFPACKDVTGTDPCDKALNFHNCMREQVETEKKTSE